jgi:hypothetical protein
MTPEGDYSIAGEAGRAVLGGVRDAAQNTLDLAHDLGAWMGNNLFDLRMASGPSSRIELPKVDPNQTTAGKVGRSLTQFVLPFLGATKALGYVAPAMGTIKKAYAADVITSAAAFDPHEKRVSNMILDMTNRDPMFGKSALDYLAANPMDSNAEGRFKNALEGAGLGLAVDGVIRGLKVVKSYYTAKGQNPAEAVQSGMEGVKKEAQEAAAKKPEETPQATQEGTGGAAPTTAPATAAQPKVEVPESMKRPEVANIAPMEPSVLVKKAPPIRADKVNQMVSDAVSGNYKAVAQTMKESDFNFDRIDTADDVKQMVDGFSSVFAKEMDTAKHGTQSFSQIQSLADELGAGTATMKQLYGEHTENLAARVLAHRSLLTASTEKVTSLAKSAMNGDADAILALRKHVALHASIQAQMKGVQTEIARALGQFRITSKSVDLAVNERNELIEAMGGHRANMEFAQKLADISDPAKLNAVVRKTAMGRTKDAMFEGWINGLLSGPATHVVNMVGNSLTALNSVAEKGTASMIGKVLRTDDAIQTGEVKAQLFGMVEGLKDAVSITNEGLQAVRASAGQAVKGDLKGAAGTLADNSNEFGGAWQAAATGNPVLDNAAFATSDALARGPSITAQNFDLDPNSIVGGLVDGLGSLMRLPSRALVTSDELFKTVHYRGELKAQAYRMARSEGLEGDALFNRVGQLVEDPTPALRSQALTAARQGTFTSPLGSQGASLQNIIQNVPGARYVMPFVRTPINLMKFVGVRTPGLNLLADSVRAEFKAGGVRRDVMLAKTAMGGSMYALGAHLAAEGHITGGGEKDQSAEKLGGIQPYSVKVGDKYYAFNRFDPFGAFLGIAADLSDISGHISADEMDQVASAATLALSRNLVSKTYLSGLVDLIDTINSGSEAKWQKYMQRQAGTVIPSGVAAVRREVDPEVKEVWSMIDAIKARLPGYSKDVPSLVNIFGEDVHYRGGLGPDIASPVYTSEKTTEPAAAEIARLNLDLRHPSRTIAASGGSKGIDLSPQQYYRYMKLIGNDTKIGGKGFKDYMTHLVQSDFYKNLPEDPTNNTYVEAKEKVIRMAFENYKKAATMQLVESDPELKQMWIQNKQNAVNALTGRPVLKFQR